MDCRSGGGGLRCRQARSFGVVGVKLWVFCGLQHASLQPAGFVPTTTCAAGQALDRAAWPPGVGSKLLSGVLVTGTRVCCARLYVVTASGRGRIGGGITRALGLSLDRVEGDAPGLPVCHGVKATFAHM